MRRGPLGPRAVVALLGLLAAGAGCATLLGVDDWHDVPCVGACTDATGESGPAETGMVDTGLEENAADGAIILGVSAIEPITDNGDANTIIASSAALTNAGTVTTMSLYIAGTGVVGNAMMAIYDASGIGGAPGELVAQTASFLVGPGWNTHPVATPVRLQPGTYYVTFMPSTNEAGPVYVKGTSHSNYFIHATAYGSFPALFGQGMSQPGLVYSEYATLTP
jgi:hypothetical protein